MSAQGSKQTRHFNSFSRNFLRDARTEDNVNMIGIIEDAGYVLLIDCLGCYVVCFDA